jgi:hypothetical protein
MGTNITRQQILARKTWSIHDGAGGAGATCSDYNCTSADFGGTDYADGLNALWNGLDPTDAFSISVWVRPEWSQSSGARVFVSIGDNSGAWNDNIFRFYFTNGGGTPLNRLIAEFRTGTNRCQALWALHSHDAIVGLGTSAATGWSSTNRGYKNTNDFSLITMTYDPTLSATMNGIRFKMYWNGNDIGAADVINDSNPTSVTFPAGITKTFRTGATLVSNANGMEGNLDELSFWNKALTAAEVLAIWNGTQAAASTDGTPMNLLTHSAATSGYLAAWWRFENNLLDSSANVNHLVNNGVSYDQTDKA